MRGLLTAPLRSLRLGRSNRPLRDCCVFGALRLQSVNACLAEVAEFREKLRVIGVAKGLCGRRVRNPSIRRVVAVKGGVRAPAGERLIETPPSCS